MQDLQCSPLWQEADIFSVLLYVDDNFLFYRIFQEFSARGAKLQPPHAAMEHV